MAAWSCYFNDAVDNSQTPNPTALFSYWLLWIWFKFDRSRWNEFPTSAQLQTSTFTTRPPTVCFRNAAASNSFRSRRHWTSVRFRRVVTPHEAPTRVRSGQTVHVTSLREFARGPLHRRETDLHSRSDMRSVRYCISARDSATRFRARGNRSPTNPVLSFSNFFDERMRRWKEMWLFIAFIVYNVPPSNRTVFRRRKVAGC